MDSPMIKKSQMAETMKEHLNKMKAKGVIKSTKKMPPKNLS